MTAASRDIVRLRGLLPSRIRCSAEGTQSHREIWVGPAARICVNILPLLKRGPGTDGREDARSSKRAYRLVRRDKVVEIASIRRPVDRNQAKPGVRAKQPDDVVFCAGIVQWQNNRFPGTARGNRTCRMVSYLSRSPMA